MAAECCTVVSESLRVTFDVFVCLWICTCVRMSYFQFSFTSNDVTERKDTVLYLNTSESESESYCLSLHGSGAELEGWSLNTPNIKETYKGNCSPSQHVILAEIAVL